MRIKETKVYSFAELSDEAKGSAIENMADINVDYNWWESTYEDATNVGIKITSSDEQRGCEGDFVESAGETAEKVISDHGKMCETYKTATKYLHDRAELVKKYSDGVTVDLVTEDNEYDFDNDCDDLDAEFLRSLLEDYRIILREEYEYLTGEQAIQDTIEANEYEFTEDGILS